MDDRDLPPPEVRVEDLTWREQEVLALLAERLTNREIGARLHLAESTVKDYVGKVLGKLYVQNRRQAVERARELGLLDTHRETDLGLTHNLPVQPTPFVGRLDELNEIKGLFAETRLLTLTGPGGIGKTRLALQAAADALEDFRNGSFFVRLAPINSPEHIVQTIAEAIYFPLSSREDPLGQLLTHLRRRQLLLVMDNFEHLLDGAEVVSQILQGAPGVQVLATAREKLNLQGETILYVVGMRLPDEGSSEELLGYDAVNLFVQSARRAHPGFEPGPDDLRHVLDICRMVEGMPLAVELAAAWLEVLPLEDIAGELQKSLDILVTEIRDVPERHRSIRAVFDHSWSLMEQVEQDVFARLSIFRGGFTREAAEEVTGGTLPILMSLVNKSLLRHEPNSRRYTIHELLRQYAQEHLEATPQTSLAAHDTHATYFADFMHQRWDHLRDSRQQAALAEIDADVENIRTAWRYWVWQANAAQIRLMMDALWRVHDIRGWYYAGGELFGQAADALRSAVGETHDDETEAVLAHMLAHQSWFMAQLGFTKRGYAQAEESIAILRRLDRREELVMPMQNWHWNASYAKCTAEALRDSRKRIEIALEFGDAWLIAYALCWYGRDAALGGNYDEARQRTEESLELFMQMGDLIASVWPALESGHIAMSRGEHAEAKRHYKHVVKAGQEADYPWATAKAARYLGDIAILQGKYEEAEDYLMQSLVVAEAIGLTRDMVLVLYDIATIDLAQGRENRAIKLLSVVIRHPLSDQARAFSVGSQFRDVRIREEAESLLDDLKSRLPPGDYSAARERGKSLELEELVAALLEAYVSRAT